MVISVLSSTSAHLSVFNFKTNLISFRLHVVTSGVIQELHAII